MNSVCLLNNWYEKKFVSDFVSLLRIFCKILTPFLFSTEIVALSFVIVICAILKKNSSVHAYFLIGLHMWMILSSFFLQVLTFLVFCLLLIQMIIVFNSLLKLKVTNLFLLIMSWFLSTLTSSQ